MEQLFTIASLWLALAVVSALIAYHIRISIALVEICVGVAVAAVLGWLGYIDFLGANQEWVRFLAATGAVFLTFLAGAELDPDVLRTKLTEVTVVGMVSFAAPFFGCAAVAYYLLGWTAQASWLCGVALSTTSMAVVYAVMLETGFNKTDFGKGILGACFITDLGTVIALGLLFSPFTYKTVVFIVATAVVLGSLPTVTHWITTMLCAPDRCDPDEMDHTHPVWVRRPGLVVRQRGGPSRLPCRHGVSGQRGERCPLDSTAADIDGGISHSLLFSSSRDTGVIAGVVGGPTRIRHAPGREGDIENLRSLSCRRTLSW